MKNAQRKNATNETSLLEFKPTPLPVWFQNVKVNNLTNFSDATKYFFFQDDGERLKHFFFSKNGNPLRECER